MKPLNQISAGDIKEFLQKVPKRIWIFSGAGLLGAILFIYVVVIPAWFTRLGIKKEIKSVQMQMATTQNLLRKQPELIKNKETFLKVSKEVKARLYEPGESSLLLGIISKLAQQSSVSVVASTPKVFEGKFPPPFNTQYEANAYQFTIEGGYHDLANFISKIENNNKILRIQTYTIRPQDKSPNKHLVDMSLTAVSTKAPAEAPK